MAVAMMLGADQCLKQSKKIKNDPLCHLFEMRFPLTINIISVHKRTPMTQERVTESKFWMGHHCHHEAGGQTRLEVVAKPHKMMQFVGSNDHP